ncbi:MAG: ABC transporter permease [Gammaproteobacteria bacterium]|nr:ABC transporter permease [Gammaproteobacteria bacterium]
MGVSLRRLAVIAPPLLWLLLFFALPILVVTAISLSRPVLGIPPYESLLDWPGPVFKGGLHNYRLLFGDSYYLQAFLGSLRIATLATLGCLLIGFPMALAIARAPARHRMILLVLLMVPFWTSFLVRTYAFASLLNSNGLINQLLQGLGLVEQPLQLLYTDFAVFLGIIYGYLPFMVLPIYAVVERQDPALLEAAADLGARPFRCFVDITLPLSMPGVLAGCLLVLIPALGEFVIPELLGGSDFLMMGRLLWLETFQNRDWPMAAALTVSLLVLVVGPVLVVQWLAERRGGQAA